VAGAIWKKLGFHFFIPGFLVPIYFKNKIHLFHKSLVGLGDGAS
jgi:hypothetical protein